MTSTGPSFLSRSRRVAAPGARLNFWRPQSVTSAVVLPADLTCQNRASPARSLWAVGCAVILTWATGCELAIHHPAEQQTEEWTATYPTSRVGSLSLTTPNGDIVVTTSTREDVRVVATKRARGDSVEGAQALLANATISEVVDRGRATLEATVPAPIRFLSRGNVRVDFEVDVPESVAVEANTVNGAIRVDKATGALSLSTVNGRIEARGLRGPVKASTVNGRIAIILDHLASGGVDAKTVNGAVGVTLPPTTAATLDASCTNCAIRTERLTVEREERPAEPRGSPRSLRATINGGGPEVRVSTVNGSIHFVGQDAPPIRSPEREADRQP